MAESFKIKQWTIEVAPDGSSWSARNIGEDGQERFFSIESGKYGEPLVKKEPAKALDLSPQTQLVQAKIGSSLEEVVLEKLPTKVPPKICGVYLKLPIFSAGELHHSITVFRSSLSNNMLQYGQILEHSTRFTVSVDGIVRYITQHFDPQQQALILQELTRYVHASKDEDEQESESFNSRVTTKDPSITGFLTNVSQYENNRYLPGYGSVGVFHLLPHQKISSISGQIESGALPVICDEFATSLKLPATHWLVQSHSQ